MSEEAPEQSVGVFDNERAPRVSHPAASLSSTDPRICTSKQTTAGNPPSGLRHCSQWVAGSLDALSRLSASSPAYTEMKPILSCLAQGKAMYMRMMPGHINTVTDGTWKRSQPGEPPFPASRPRIPTLPRHHFCTTKYYRKVTWSFPGMAEPWSRASSESLEVVQWDKGDQTLHVVEPLASWTCVPTDGNLLASHGLERHLWK